jgi:hypothetical protein
VSLEISSSDPETIKQLRGIAEAEPDKVLALPISPMEGKEIFTLVIEHYAALSAGTAVLIMALRNRIGSLKVTKSGVELKATAKEKALSGDK